MDVTTAPDFVEELRWRGMIHTMSEGAEEVLKKEKITAYIGFDPTADSLHVGSLLQIMILVHLQRHGHSPIALAGGGTGMIGDPSGKTKERQLLTLERLEQNLEGIKAQLAHFLAFDGVPNPAVMPNNADWLRPLLLIDFMRDIGKHFTVNYMMAKDSIKSRLSSDEGISYTEFTYMLLQAYDFYALYQSHGCTFQMGGSDQWGNITAGAELIRRVADGKAYGLTSPLVMSATGVKFGKTESGTVWLDPKRTSPFRFYQYWVNTADVDVIQFMKYFTLLGPDEVAEYEEAIQTAPERREAQIRLAEEVTRMVHGEESLARAQQATDVLFGGGEIAGLSAEELLDIFADVPSSTIAKESLSGEGMSIVDMVVKTGLETSKKRSRDLIKGGGLNLNNQRVESVDLIVGLDTAIEGQVLILRKGKKKYHLVQVGE
jgi:tyrosyl-tRNA synthetase